MGNAILHARVCGVEDSVDLGISYEKYKTLSPNQKNQLIAEYQADVVDMFVIEEQEPQ